MAEPQSDADRIRLKRLAKLNGSANPAASGTQSDKAAPSSAASAPPTAPKASSPISNQPNPFAQLGLKRESPNTQINIRSASNNTSTIPAKRAKETPAKAEETLEEWENKTLGQIFRVTLEEGRTVDHHGHQLIYLSGVRKDLADEDQPIRLSIEYLETVILEAVPQRSKPSPLTYLLACWKRIIRQISTTKQENDKLAILREARRLCMSYCIFAVTMPAIFDLDTPARSPLAKHLLLDSQDDGGIDHEFLVELVSRSQEDETALEMVVDAMNVLSNDLARMTINHNYKPYVLALQRVIQYPAILTALAESHRFLPEGVTAGLFEVETFLGPFFQLSPLQQEVVENAFSSPQTRDRSSIASAQHALRLTLKVHQDELFTIADKFVKGGAGPRNAMLDWFAAALNLNHKRRAMRVQQQTVSSDGFFANLTVCLDRLCEPFMSADFSKIDRIEVDYLRRNPRVDIKDETKLNASEAEAEEFFSKPAEGTSNFISEVFFLNLAAHHYGTEAMNAKLTQLEKSSNHMRRQLDQMARDRANYASNAAQLALFDASLEKYKAQLDKGLCYMYGIEGILLDEINQGRSMQFMRYVLVWLLRVVQPQSSFPKGEIVLPLPDEQTEAFKCLPEYFLEDVVENFKFIMRRIPKVIIGSQSEELIVLCISFLRSSEYIKNPYLKAGLVTILFHGSYPSFGRAKGVLGDTLTSAPFPGKYLLHSLMKFYIEVENTGAHTQFYDKFNIRYEIFQIIKCIWSNTHYRRQLSQEAKVNLDFFVRFVNLLLNDVTYVLDESLTSLHAIHDLQQDLKAEDLEESVRKEKDEALSQAQGKAKSYMSLTNETMAMLNLFTEALADSFTMPEIVQRLADMLDYNLDAMAGPKSRNLKVEDPSQYNFNPLTLLSEIMDVFLNLAGKPNFITAIARDGRSYKPANFQAAAQITQSKGIKSPEVLARWAQLSAKIAEARAIEDEEDEEYADAPAEFFDPILATLMSDPVMLPTSRNIVDRSTIRSHLLSDPNDPFNRQPLKIEDVVPDEALRQQIADFKAEKRAARLAPMNTDTEMKDE